MDRCRRQSRVGEHAYSPMPRTASCESSWRSSPMLRLEACRRRRGSVQVPTLFMRMQFLLVHVWSSQLHMRMSVRAHAHVHHMRTHELTQAACAMLCTDGCEYRIRMLVHMLSHVYAHTDAKCLHAHIYTHANAMTRCTCT
jgi:hypothetical protein